jgi:plasmid maintenance system antidote protein VapI
LKQNLNLLIAIREQGLRQKDFAKILNVHPTTISSVINGRLNLPDAEKIRYAKTLGKKVEDIFLN